MVMAKYEILFWKNARNEKPVAKWLKNLTHADREYFGAIFFDLANDGPYVMNPKKVKHLEHNLWEIRDLRTGPGYRIYFGFDGDVLCIVVHSGNKSSQNRDIMTAKKRLGEIWEK